MMLLSLGFVISGCTSGFSALNCAGWNQHRPSRSSANAMDRRDKEWTRNHNQGGINRGCWKAPKLVSIQNRPSMRESWVTSS